MKKAIETIASPAGAISGFMTLILVLVVVVVWQATEGVTWALFAIGALTTIVLVSIGAGIAMLAQHVNAKQDERLMMVNFRENTAMLQQQFRAQKELAMAMMSTMKTQQIVNSHQQQIEMPELPELPDGIFDDL